MPKHLSMVGCGGFGPATADVAMMVNAAAKELAIEAAATMFFDFMELSFLKTSDASREIGVGAPAFIAKPEGFNKSVVSIYLMSRASRLCEAVAPANELPVDPHAANDASHLSMNALLELFRFHRVRRLPVVAGR